MDEKSNLGAAHKKHREDNWPMNNNWRSWGSWFSWGSPIGLGLFYALVILSTGGFIWILRLHT